MKTKNKKHLTVQWGKWHKSEKSKRMSIIAIVELYPRWYKSRKDVPKLGRGAGEGLAGEVALRWALVQQEWVRK